MTNHWNVGERRQEPRFTVQTPVFIDFQGYQRLIATTRDVSDHGIGLRIRGQQPDYGQKVLIQCREEQFEAKVRHCETSGDLAFTVGLELEGRITDQQMDALLSSESLS